MKTTDKNSFYPEMSSLISYPMPSVIPENTHTHTSITKHYTDPTGCICVCAHLTSTRSNTDKYEAMNLRGRAWLEWKGMRCCDSILIKMFSKIKLLFRSLNSFCYIAGT